MFKKYVSIFLCFAMLLGLVALPQANAEGNTFRYIENTTGSPLYTAVRIDGFEGTLYAYTQQNGQTAFRVYGALDGKEGFYPVDVTKPENYKPGDKLKVVINSTQMVLDTQANLATPVVDAQQAPAPAGFVAEAGITNLFTNATKKVFYASVNGGAPQYYEAVPKADFAKYGIQSTQAYAPKPGSLVVDVLNNDYIVYLNDSSALSAKAKDAVLAAAVTPTPKPTATPKPSASSKKTTTSKTTTKNTKTTTSKRTTINRTAPKSTYSTYKQDEPSLRVKYYQEILSELGYFNSVNDGIYGKLTKTAIKEYQARNGLKANGILNKETVKSLNAWTHVNAKGVAQQPIRNFINDTKETKESVKDVSIGLSLSKPYYTVGEGIYVTTRDLKRNPHKKLNITVDVINLDTRSQVASETVKNAKKDPISLYTVAYTPGKYRARVFVSRGKGMVLGDLKDFQVFPSVPVGPGMVAPDGSIVYPGGLGTAPGVVPGPVPGAPGTPVAPGTIPSYPGAPGGPGSVGSSDPVFGIVPGGPTNPVGPGDQPVAPPPHPSNPNSQETPEAKDPAAPSVLTAPAEGTPSTTAPTSPATGGSPASGSGASPVVPAPEQPSTGAQTPPASPSGTESQGTPAGSAPSSEGSAGASEPPKATENTAQGGENAQPATSSSGATSEQAPPQPVASPETTNTSAETAPTGTTLRKAQNGPELKMDEFKLEVVKPKQSEVALNKTVTFVVRLTNNLYSADKYTATLLLNGDAAKEAKFEKNVETGDIEAIFTFTFKKAKEYTFQVTAKNGMSGTKPFTTHEFSYTITAPTETAEN